MNNNTRSSGPVDVLETLAGWCNEHGIGKAEHERRSATYAAVAELIEAASLLEREFRRVYPIYYYAEPWAHETNVPLNAVKTALTNIRSAS